LPKAIRLLSQLAKSVWLNRPIIVGETNMAAWKRPLEESGCGTNAGQAYSQGSRRGKLLSPARRRNCVDHVMKR